MDPVDTDFSLKSAALVTISTRITVTDQTVEHRFMGSVLYPQRVPAVQRIWGNAAGSRNSHFVCNQRIYHSVIEHNDELLNTSQDFSAFIPHQAAAVAADQA
jgi:hypothetical protein